MDSEFCRWRRCGESGHVAINLSYSPDRTLMTIKLLVIAIAVLLGVVVGIVAALLTKVQGAHIARAIRDGGVGFVGTVTLTMILLDHLRMM